MTEANPPRSARLRLAAAGLAVLVPVLVSACGSGNAQPSTKTAATPNPALAHGRSGDLTFDDGYIPKPASPDVAAAYLTVTNDGAEPERMTATVTDVTDMVMPMTEVSRNGVGSMVELPSLEVAPHSSFVLAPGHAHLMLEHPSRALQVGDHVAVTMTFDHAGPVLLDLPVVPLTGP